MANSELKIGISYKTYECGGVRAIFRLVIVWFRRGKELRKI